MGHGDDKQGTDKLDRILRLLGVIAAKDMPQTDQIAMLNRFGFAPKEIAEIIGTSANTVRVSLVSIRRAEAMGGRRKFGKERTDG
jgi:hypothetical protein